jgi:putative aldouronate transport system substrate-binding protein
MVSRTIEATDGVVVHNATTDAYRAYLEWMHMAYEEGLIHPEIYTLSGDQHNALGQDNLVGVFQSWHSHGFLQTDEEQALNNPMLRPLTSEWSQEGVLPRSSGFSIGQFAITDNAEDPATIIRLIDYFYTEEGAIFANHGPEGAYWVYDTHAETGEQVRVLAPGIDPEDGNERGRVTPYFGFPAPQLIPSGIPKVLQDTSQPIEDPLTEFLQEETYETVYTYGKVAIPPTMLTSEEADSIAVITADLEIEIDRQEASFVTGITPINDDTWAGFVATLEQIGVSDLVDIWQNAHNRWLDAAQ